MSNLNKKNTKYTSLTSSYQGPPGPASYDPNLDVSHTKPPKWTIKGGNSREIPIIKNLPGPGQYDPRPQESSIKALILGKHYIMDNTSKPGPGQYNTEQSQLSRIGFKIGNSKRYIEDKSKSPGPADYNNTTQKHIPSYKLAKESISEKKIQKTVGPGAYNIPSLMRTDIGCIIIPRRDKAISLITPAPNAYDTTTRERIKSYIIGQSKKETKKSISPGPGDYEPLNTKESLGYSIGRSKRSSLKMEQIPGPGAYKLVKPSYAPKYSIFQKHKERLNTEGPGPQSYTIGEFRDSKSVIFPHAKRDSQSKVSIPGPGDYDTEQKVKKPQVSIIFGREKRSFSTAEAQFVPGPGQYDVKYTLSLKRNK